ncbi:MAG: MacS family sensor histidine kinase [Mycobacteriaceae bacterium]
MPLWRASQAFRLLTQLYALTFQIASVQYYENQQLSWILFAIMAMWSGGSALALSQSWCKPWIIVVVDHVMAIALMVSTRLIADADWYTHHQTFPTTLWVTNAVIAVAVLRGPLFGVISALLLSCVSAAVRSQLHWNLWQDATAPVLVSVGLALGLAAQTAFRAHEELRKAARVAAATQERERLAREVHDGVLQVLALVKRKGTEIGGPAAELAILAGEQEVALRELISEHHHNSVLSSVSDNLLVDVRPLLRKRTSVMVSVSAPGQPVVLPEQVAMKLVAILGAALSNVEIHAGENSKAYVLLEDLATEVVLSIRDNGPGIPEGRLAQAASEGRLGVSASLLGRVRDLGGIATLQTAPGEGTEWEIRIPKQMR